MFAGTYVADTYDAIIIEIDLNNNDVVTIKSVLWNIFAYMFIRLFVTL